MARICGWITKLTYKSISLVVWFLHSWMTPSWSKTSLKVTFSFSKTVSIWEALILLYFQNIFSASWKRPKRVCKTFFLSSSSFLAYFFHDFQLLIENCESGPNPNPYFSPENCLKMPNWLISRNVEIKTITKSRELFLIACRF